MRKKRQLPKLFKRFIEKVLKYFEKSFKTEFQEFLTSAIISCISLLSLSSMLISFSMEAILE